MVVNRTHCNIIITGLHLWSISWVGTQQKLQWYCQKSGEKKKIAFVNPRDKTARLSVCNLFFFSLQPTTKTNISRIHSMYKMLLTTSLLRKKQIIYFPFVNEKLVWWREYENDSLFWALGLFLCWCCCFLLLFYYYYFIIIFISSSSRIVKSAQQVVNGKTITNTILNKTMDIRKENTLTK